MSADFEDWTRGLELVVNVTSDFPDWTVAAQVTGGSTGGYASLTGPGQTATPGKLTQAGPFEVDSVGTTGSTGAGVKVSDTTAASGNPNGVPSVDIRATQNPVRLTTGVVGSGNVIQLVVGSPADTKEIALVCQPVGGGGKVTMNGNMNRLGVDTGGVNGIVTAVSATGPARDQLGFFGATAVNQANITGSRGGNAALASLLTALATYGLIVDNSTP